MMLFTERRPQRSTQGRRRVKHLLTSLLMGCVLPVVAAQGAAPASAPASHPATGPASGKVVDFQPGIRIDWRTREVLAEATVLMREGMIELFACSPKQREHEAIVRLEARPLHLYHALGLIGLQPGHPLRMNETTQKVESAEGDSVEVDVRWEQDNRARQQPIEHWIQLAGSRKSPERLDWVFAGSTKTEDGFAADFEGTVISLVDFSTSLIAMPEQHSSSNDELWLQPATANIPALGTRCTLVFRAGALHVSMDAMARITFQRRVVTRAELARQLSATLKENPQLRVRLSIHPDCPRSESDAVQRQIRALGVKDRDLATTRPSAQAEWEHDPQALSAWLRGQLASTRPAAGAEWGDSSRHLVSDLRERGALFHGRTQHLSAYLAGVSEQVRDFLWTDAGAAPPLRNGKAH